MTLFRTAFDDTSSQTNQIYVSVNGNDSNDGSLAAPVATIARATEIANTMKLSQNNDIYINIESGEHFIDNKLTFTSKDSGLNGNNIIYSGASRETTIINAGIDVTDSFSGSGNIQTAVISEGDARQLYINGEPATISRSAQLTGVELYNPVYNDSGSLISVDGLVVPASNVPESFINENSAEFIYEYEWLKSRFTVEKITKLDNGNYALSFGKAFSYLPLSTLSSRINDMKFYLENCACFVDLEDEFSFDRKNKKITYYKKANETITKAFIPNIDGFIDICGDKNNIVKNIIFENLTFENGGWAYPSKDGLHMGQAEKIYTAPNQYSERNGVLIPGQIELNYCENIIFRNNTVKNCGSMAIALNEAAKNCEISGNIIKNTAAGAIQLGHFEHYRGTPEYKFCVGNKIENNTITDISLQYSTSPAITVYFASNSKISHNTILNTPYTGISLGWGWGEVVDSAKNNEISYNRIENVMTTLRDGAHIYTNGYMENVKIFGNYMRKSSDNTSNRIGNYGGIYLDNGSCNIEAYNNVVEECYRWFCVPDPKVGTNGAISFHDNYSDTLRYSAESPYISVSNYKLTYLHSDEVNKIKQNAGAFN